MAARRIKKVWYVIFKQTINSIDMDKVCESFPHKKENSLDESLIAINQHFSLMNEFFGQPQKCEEDFINNWQVNNKGWSASCWQSTNTGWSTSTRIAV